MDTELILALYDQDRISVRLYGMQREETSHTVRHISTSGEGFIIYSNLNSTNVEEVIREQIANVENPGCDFHWVVFQHDTPAKLKERLLAHGFGAEDPETIMVLDVEDVSSALLEPVHVEVQQINDPNKIDDVLTICHQVWHSDYSSMAQSLTKRLIDAPHSLVAHQKSFDT